MKHKKNIKKSNASPLISYSFVLLLIFMAISILLPITYGSTYTVSYLGKNVIGNGNVLLSMTNGLTTYFYGGSTNTIKSATAPTVSWTISNSIIISTGSNTLYASIGYATSNAESFNSPVTTSNDLIVGIGANVILNNGAIFLANTPTRSSNAILTFSTISTPSGTKKGYVCFHCQRRSKLKESKCRTFKGRPRGLNK